MKGKKIYIAGGITGVPDYKEHFAKAEEYLIFLCLSVERFLQIIHNIRLSMRIIRNIFILYMIMKIRFIFMSMECTAFYGFWITLIFMIYVTFNHIWLSDI